MAVFYNQANLTYSGGSASSNIVSGEIIGSLTVTKTAVVDEYGIGDTLTYVVSLINTSDDPLTGITLTDDLGAYTVGELTAVPLAYVDGSVKYFLNGVLTDAPTAAAGPPLVFEGITVPAQGNAAIVYSAYVTVSAPPCECGEVTNTVTASGSCVAAETSAQETVRAVNAPVLTISKCMSPSTVTCCGALTFTLTVRNFGCAAAVATDDVVITDTFAPILSDITVLVDGTQVDENTAYTYNRETGEFATVEGFITVPAAAFVQNPETLEWSVTPGETVITVRGTVCSVCDNGEN